MKLLIATPEYTPALPWMRASKALVVADLRAHGVDVVEQSVIHTYLCSARDDLVVAAYRAEADIILWWDADIECMTPTCVREMLAADRDIIGCAHPKRGGGLACGMREARAPEGALLAVDRISTGFLLTRIGVFDRIREAHPERALSGGFGYFHTPITNGERIGEDYALCDDARALGIQPYAYIPAVCRHWTLQPLTGSLLDVFAKDDAK